MNRGPDSGRRIVLAFHGIGEPHPWCPADERPYWCSHARFASVVDALLDECAAAGIKPIFTFDDGNDSDVRVAAPALARRGAQGEFFVCTGRLERPGYVDAGALRELQRSGMVVGSHGRDHVDWRRCDDATLAAEMIGALEDLRTLLDAPVDSIAIPFGSYDRRVVRALARLDVKTIYCSDADLPRDGDFLVPRFAVMHDWTSEHVRQVVARGAWDLATLRRRAIQFLKRNLPR